MHQSSRRPQRSNTHLQPDALHRSVKPLQCAWTRWRTQRAAPSVEAHTRAHAASRPKASARGSRTALGAGGWWGSPSRLKTRMPRVAGHRSRTATEMASYLVAQGSQLQHCKGTKGGVQLIPPCQCQRAGIQARRRCRLVRLRRHYGRSLTFSLDYTLLASVDYYVAAAAASGHYTPKACGSCRTRFRSGENGACTTA